jgi:hypothetical protein
MWQMDFALPPAAVEDLNHQLRLNETVLRWVVLRKDLPPLAPYAKDRSSCSSSALSFAASALADEQHVLEGEEAPAAAGQGADAGDDSMAPSTINAQVDTGHGQLAHLYR